MAENLHLKPYQKAAVDATIGAIEKGNRKLLVSIPTGVDKLSIVFGIIDDLANKSCNKINIFIIFSNKNLYLRFNEYLRKIYTDILEKGVNIFYSYHGLKDKERIEDLSESDYVIGVDYVIPELSNLKPNATVIGFTINKTVKKGILKDAECVFNYSLEQSVCDGVVRAAFEPDLYGQAYEGFCKRLLTSITDGVEADAGNVFDPGYDFIIESKAQRIIVECKSYRDKNIPLDKTEYSAQLLNASGQATDIRLLFLMGLTSEADKELIYKKYNITVWDIANFLYYANNSDDLLDEIGSLAFYPISDIAPIKSVGWSPEEKQYASNRVNDYGNDFITRLQSCKSGEAAFKEYEDLCADIITYLFVGEFSKIKRQQRSVDELFRMDMICALKGTSEFWLTLSKYYNSKFIVFEFKNYSNELDQNIIYVTEKYLFNAALRNVAIIISRKGFAENAKIAADGCIKENGKLIMDITDNDLIKMIKKKEEGEEPADHLLSLLEERLMMIGK